MVLSYDPSGSVLGQIYITGDGADKIYRSIEDAIHDERLPPGTALPSVRHLATQLGVNKNTVAAAYRRLRRAGLVSGEGRRGTLVLAQPSMAKPTRLDLPSGLVNLMDGNPDPHLLPPLGPALRAIETRPQLYGHSRNLPDLLAWAAADFAAEGVPADHLAVTAGALDGIERLYRVGVRPGDRVAVEDPGYEGILGLTRALGLVPVPVGVDDDSARPDELTAAVRGGAKAFVFSSRAQNPTGAAVTPERAAVLAERLAEAPGVLAIDDDHGALVAGAPYRPIHVRDGGRWAIVRSLSKALGPDFRLALVAGDPETIARLELRQALGMRWQSHLLQRLAHLLLVSPEGRDAIATAAAVYARRRTALLATLAERGIRAMGRSGLNLWVPVTEESAVVQALAQRGWAVRSGDAYRLRAGPGIRVTLSGLTEGTIPRFADDLAAVLNPTKAGNLAG